MPLFPPRKSEGVAATRRGTEVPFAYPDQFEPPAVEVLQDVFAWVAVDESKAIEGIIATAEGMPAFGDQGRIEGFRRVAKLTATMYGVPVRLVRFVRQDVVDEVQP